MRVAGFMLVLLTLSGTATAACNAGVFDTGTAVGQPAVKVASANEPADIAVESLLPRGWIMQDPGRHRVPVKVSAGPWRSSLESIATAANVCVTLDWGKRVARVEDAAPVMPASAQTTSEAEVASPKSEQAPIAPLPQGLLGDISSQTLKFDLRVGETLRTALTRWAKESGWSLVWQAQVDYPIQAAAEFPPGTSFRDALRQTMKAFWQQTQWLKATVYKNHVVVIEGSNA